MASSSAGSSSSAAAAADNAPEAGSSKASTNTEQQEKVVSDQSEASKPHSEDEDEKPASTGSTGSQQQSQASTTTTTAGSPSTNVRRVKVYQLEQESWTDLGTGYCDVYAHMPVGVARHQSEDLWADVDEADEEAGPWIAVTPEHRSEESKDSSNSSSSSDEAGQGHQQQEFLWRTTIRAVMLVTMTSGDDDEDDNSAFGFHRQQDTLVVWCEPDGTEMALSFANVQACAEIWHFIHRVKQYLLEGHHQHLALPLDSSGGSSSDELTSSPQQFYNGAGPGLQLANHQSGTLPPPSFDNISHVLDSLKWQTRTPSGRERLANWIVKNDYISALIALKTDAEDLESLDTLHTLCSILQTMLLLNDNLIFDHIISDDIFIGVAGILEYDPEFPKMKANYVSHLSDPARFVQVVPIQHGPTLQKIHQTYRLSYLKDVMLARIIDDPTYTMLNSFIFFHQIDIVQHLQQDQHFIRALFGLFEQPADDSHPESIEKQREAILLLHQFCILAKNLQLTARHVFYRSMADKGLLRALEVVLQRTAHLSGSAHTARTEAENAVRVTAIEILMMLIDHHPNAVRSYCLRSTSNAANSTEAIQTDEEEEEEEKQQPKGQSLISFLIALLNAEEDLGIQAQVAEAIKVLAHAGGLSPAAAAAAASAASDHGLAENARLRNEDPETEKFLQYFYDHCIEDLFRPILDLPDPADQPNGLLSLAVGQSSLFAQLCDLLVHFIGAHTFRSKYFVLSSPICTRVARLFKTTQKHLALAAVRFFKATLVRRDDFYNRYLVKHDLLKPVLEATLRESDKDNLVASACLDFFEFIRFHNTKPLINCLLERHEDLMQTLRKQHKTMELLVMRWEANNEPPPPPPAEGDSATERNASAGRAGGYGSRQSSTLDEEEESYFNDSSSDDEEPAPAPAAIPMPAATPASPVLSSPSNKKRKIDDGNARKRARTDSAPPPIPSGRGPAGKGADNGNMVRSPALVFQEMAVKGAQRRPRSSSPSNPPPSSEKSTKAVSLVDYGGDDDDDDDESAARPGTPTTTPSTPPTSKLKRSDSTDVLSHLGSPFQSIETNTISSQLRGDKDEDEDQDGGSPTAASSRPPPPPSLKSLGEKRAREEEEEDVLLKKKTKPNSGSAAANTSISGKGRGFASGLTSKLKFNFGLGGGSSGANNSSSNSSGGSGSKKGS